MEESKFLEAQNLKNQIHNLENLIKDLKRENAKICVSWPEIKTEYDYTGMTAWRTDTWTENRVNQLPKSLEDKVIQLINNELEKLKEEFNNL